MRTMTRHALIFVYVALLTGAPVYLVYAQGTRDAKSDAIPQTKPAGEAKTSETKILEVGAKLLQSNSPLKPFDIYLVGFHPMKNHPEDQMEVHHYCSQVNEDFAQCVLFDSNMANANLNGIEYIISEKLFAKLPEAEKKYWHPHNGEILSGQFVAPDIPGIAEKALMKGKMNSYGKTWHVWNTGHDEKHGDMLPLGEPMLAWSFNRDGEARQKFVRPTQDISGVTDKKDATGN